MTIFSTIGVSVGLHIDGLIACRAGGKLGDAGHVVGRVAQPVLGIAQPLGDGDRLDDLVAREFVGFELAPAARSHAARAELGLIPEEEKGEAGRGGQSVGGTGQQD